MGMLAAKDIFYVLRCYYDSSSIPVWLFQDGLIANTNFSNSLLNLVDLATGLNENCMKSLNEGSWQFIQNYQNEFYLFFYLNENTSHEYTALIGPILHDIPEGDTSGLNFSFSNHIWSDFHNEVVDLLATSDIDSFARNISFIMRLFDVTPPDIDEIKDAYKKHMFVSSSYSPIINDAIAAISEKLQSKLSLQVIADEINISPKYLSCLFAKETGMNFCDFVQFSRVKMARKYLTESQMSYTDICYALGFSSQSYFNSVFKKYTGYTPKEYRSLEQNSTGDVESVHVK